MNQPIQTALLYLCVKFMLLCGLSCNYVVNSPKNPIGFKFNDHDMMRFAKDMIL